MSVYQDQYHLPAFDYGSYEKIKIEQDGPVYICSFDDPGNLNAMSYLQMSEFNDFLLKVRLDKDCRVIVLTGEGRSFCAGFNLDDHALPHPDDMGETQYMYYIMQRICSDQAVYMHRCEQTIIGALKGYAVGGGLSLACACDMRILGESFKMNAGYLAIGLTGTDMSGSFYLPKIIGYERAYRVLSSTDRFDAETLHSWGFGLKVVPDDEGSGRSGGTRAPSVRDHLALRSQAHQRGDALLYRRHVFRDADQDGEPQPGARDHNRRWPHGPLEDESEEQRSGQSRSREVSVPQPVSYLVQYAPTSRPTRPLPARRSSCIRPTIDPANSFIRKIDRFTPESAIM